MQRDLDVLESGADRDLLQLHKESCKAWPLGRNEPSTRTGQGHPAWKQLGTEGPGVPVGTAVRGSQQRALGQRGMEVSWLRWDSRGGILPLCWGALGGPGPSGESPGHEERLLGLEQRRLRRSSPMAVSTRREVRRGRSRALLSVAQGQAQRPRAQPGAAPAGGRAGRGGAGGRGRGAGAAGSRVPAPPRPGSPRGGQMAAAGAEERRGAWGAAGPERGPGPGPGPGPVPLGSLLSRLPLSAPPPRRRTASQCKPEPPLLRTSKRTIYTAGRPPWYSETGAPVDEAFVIGGPRGRAGPGRAGVGGWEGAGTALTVPARPRAVRRQRLGQDDGGDADHRGAGRALGRAALHGLLLQGECGTARCDTAQHGVARHGVTRHSTARRGAERCRCPQVLDEGQQALAARSDYNFDHPDAFDFELLVSVLRKLKKGKSVKVPVYDFTTHSRRREWKTVYGANVIVFEGILAFANKELLKLLDMKVFVDTDSDIRLVRRLQRDIMERGRDIVGVIKQYNKFVKPAFEQYIEPTVQVADIVVPRGGENFVALDLIVQHVHSQLEKGNSGLCPPRAAPAKDVKCPGEHAAGAGHAHHHQEQRHDQGRIHLLLQAPDEAVDRARPLLSATEVGYGGDAPRDDVRREAIPQAEDHRRVHTESRGDHGAGPDCCLQGHPPGQDPDPDQPRHGGARAPLPAPAQGDQRGLRHPHGQHRVHGGRGHDGSARPAGPRRAGGQDLPAVAADGGDGGALGGLRLSSCPHHHHRCGQEDQ
uniref:uridine/cytidine kinase n=1 Tax=Cairina moschata TaxID=8855 RepID=A0A8C3BSY2_CAIMO